MDKTLTIFGHHDCLSRLQFPDIITLQVKSGLQYRSFAGYRHNLVVLIIEGGANSPRVTHGKHLTASSQSTYNISPVKIGHGRSEHITHVHMVVDVVGDVCPMESFGLRFLENAFHLSVETVSHPFKHDVTVAEDSRTLSLCCNLVEHLVDVRHVEVSTKAEVFCFPVVSSQKGMYIFQPALAGCGVSEVPHVKLSCKREVLVGKMCIGKLSFIKVYESFLHRSENLSNGIGSFCLFTKHVFIAGLGMEFHTSHSGSFLAAVVLLLHHQIEFVQPVHPGPILLLIILQRLQQSDHCNTAFML